MMIPTITSLLRALSEGMQSLSKSFSVSIEITIGFFFIFCWYGELQSIFIIHRFCISEFAYFLKFFSNPHINICGDFAAFVDVHKAAKYLKPPVCMVPAMVKKSDALPFFELSYCN